MWVVKLKRKKLQYSLLGLIMTIAIILISVSSIIAVISGQFTNEYYKGDRTPDLNITTSKDSVRDKTKNWYDKNKSELRNYKEYEMYSISTNVKFDGKSNTSLMSHIIPVKSIDDLSNRVEIIEGDKNQKSPKKGEVWIPSTLADSKDLDIGKNVEIIDSKGKKINFKIAAIVNDSSQPSLAIGVLYLYINDIDRVMIENLPKATLITMNSDGDLTMKSEELTGYINEPLAGNIIDKGLYIMSVNMTASISVGLGFMVSIIIMIALILILNSNIKNNILKEYKAIGIYKAMGLSSKRIKGIYLKGYLATSIISSIVGMALSVPIVSFICNIAFKYMGKYSFDISSFMIIVIVFLVFNLIVYITLILSLKSINKIKPVDAINTGVKSTKSKMSKSLIKNNSNSFIMAVNDIFKYKKSNFITLIILTLAIYISILFLSLYNSLNTLDNNLYKIFGVAKSDVTISGANDIENSIKDVREYLDNDSRVDDYYIWDYFGQKNVTVDNSKYNIKNSIMVATIYNKFNEEDFSIAEGVNPRNKKEIALTTTILKESNLKIGDYINLQVNGKEKRFLISGSYNSMMSNGYTLRLTSEALDNDSGNIAFVNLKNIDDYNDLKNDINKKFNGVVVERVYEVLQDISAQVIDTIVPISLITLIGTLIFALINIINVILINNLDNRANYGIMKSLGFTSAYIKRRSNFRILILTSLAAIIGFIANILTTKKLLELCIGFDVLNFNINMILVFIFIVFILIALVMKICNRAIDKISIIDLIKE